jgi:uncharacterized protein (DUF427 family)
MKAIWKSQVLAESEETIVIEGNHYFPPDSVDTRFMRPSETTTFCPWKGLASYHDIVVGDEVNSGAAWFYPEPKEAAKEIRDYLAFWRGVEVTV